MQAIREGVESEIPADGECITLSYFIQVNAFITRNPNTVLANKIVSCYLLFTCVS